MTGVQTCALPIFFLPLFFSAYIRDTLFREEKEERQYYRELKNLNFQIRKIGVNINQVAAKINSGYKKYDSVFYLQKSLSQVEEEVKKLIEKLEEDSGNHKMDKDYFHCLAVYRNSVHSFLSPHDFLLTRFSSQAKILHCFSLRVLRKCPYFFH